MFVASIALFSTDDDTTPGVDGRVPGAQPRPLEHILDDCRHAIARSASWLCFRGHDPADHPDHVEAVRQARAAGGRVQLVTTARALDAEGLTALRDAGLEQIFVRFAGGTAATHDAVCGEGSFANALATLDLAWQLNDLLPRATLLLTATSASEVQDWVGSVRNTCDVIEVVQPGAGPGEGALRALAPPRHVALRALHLAWEASHAANVELTVRGFVGHPEVPAPRPTPPIPVSATLLQLCRSRVPLLYGANGSWLAPADAPKPALNALHRGGGITELGLELAAHGVPALDLPQELGGLGLQAHPGDGPDPVDPDALLMLDFDHLHEPADLRPLPAWVGLGADASIQVASAFPTDALLCGVTLPRLAKALSAAGARAHFHRGTAGDAASLAELDLSGRDAVITAGWHDALTLWQNPTLPPQARLIVLDHALLSGMEAWHLAFDAAANPSWWPSERIEVVSPYPREVAAYRQLGVPLRQVHWRPLPVPDLPAPTPAASTGTLAAAGIQRRDLRTLGAAAAIARHGASITLYNPWRSPPAPIRAGGELPLAAYAKAIAASRAVIVCLDADPRRPAGLAAISLARAAGRPVIATATPTTVAHLIHDQDALLVPAGSPRALAEALDRVATDDALVARLSAGAVHHHSYASLDAWAKELLQGAPHQRVWSTTTAPRGPFRAWPT